MELWSLLQWSDTALCSDEVSSLAQLQRASMYKITPTKSKADESALTHLCCFKWWGDIVENPPLYERGERLSDGDTSLSMISH